MKRSLGTVTLFLSLLSCEAQLAGPASVTPSSDTGGSGGTLQPGIVGGVAGGGGVSSANAGVSGSLGSGGSTNATGGSGSGGVGVAPDAGVSSGGGAAMALPCDVQTLLMNRCQTCHGITPALGTPSSLVTYRDLTSPSKLDPTKTEAVMAVARMQNAALPMPPAPGTPVAMQQISAMQAWIAAGYPNGVSCGTTADGGTSDGSTSDGGGSTPDPFAIPATCTSKAMWTGGNKGSASMNPGMACIKCHATNEAPKFIIAGTVYPTAHEPDLCNGGNVVTGARVVITGADGKTLTLTPNAAGNFQSTAAVAKPYRAMVTYLGRERLMITPQTSGDCNSCHTQMGATMAPGRVLLP